MEILIIVPFRTAMLLPHLLKDNFGIKEPHMGMKGHPAGGAVG